MMKTKGKKFLAKIFPERIYAKSSHGVLNVFLSFFLTLLAFLYLISAGFSHNVSDIVGLYGENLLNTILIIPLPLYLLLFFYSIYHIFEFIITGGKTTKLLNDEIQIGGKAYSYLVVNIVILLVISSLLLLPSFLSSNNAIIRVSGNQNNGRILTSLNSKEYYPLSGGEVTLPREKITYGFYVLYSIDDENYITQSSTPLPMRGKNINLDLEKNKILLIYPKNKFSLLNGTIIIDGKTIELTDNMAYTSSNNIKPGTFSFTFYQNGQVNTVNVTLTKDEVKQAVIKKYFNQ